MPGTGGRGDSRDMTCTELSQTHHVDADRGPCGRAGCARLCTEAGLTAAREAHHSRMLARARRILTDPHQAEEAVQEALLRAWRGCAAFDPAGGPLGNWLVVITRNAAIDMVKARARRPAVASAHADVVGDRLLDARSGVDLVVVRAELVEALGTLGHRHREAVVEVVLRDRPYAAVASDLGVPAGTVRTRVHYGLRALRDALTVQDAA